MYVYMLDFSGSTILTSSEVNGVLLCSRPPAQSGGKTALKCSTSLWESRCPVAAGGECLLNEGGVQDQGVGRQRGRS